MMMGIPPTDPPPQNIQSVVLAGAGFPIIESELVVTRCGRTLLGTFPHRNGNHFSARELMLEGLRRRCLHGDFWSYATFLFFSQFPFPVCLRTDVCPHVNISEIRSCAMQKVRHK